MVNWIYKYEWDCLEREVHLERKLPWKQPWITLMSISWRSKEKKSRRFGQRKEENQQCHVLGAKWRGFQEKRRGQLCENWESGFYYRSTSCFLYTSLKIMKTTPSKTKIIVVGRLDRPRLTGSKGRFRTSRNRFYSSARSRVNELKLFLAFLFSAQQFTAQEAQLRTCPHVLGGGGCEPG